MFIEFQFEKTVCFFKFLLLFVFKHTNHPVECYPENRQPYKLNPCHARLARVAPARVSRSAPFCFPISHSIVSVTKSSCPIASSLDIVSSRQSSLNVPRWQEQPVNSSTPRVLCSDVSASVLKSRQEGETSKEIPRRPMIHSTGRLMITTSPKAHTSCKAQTLWQSRDCSNMTLE